MFVFNTRQMQLEQDPHLFMSSESFKKLKQLEHDTVLTIWKGTYQLEQELHFLCPLRVLIS